MVSTLSLPSCLECNMKRTTLLRPRNSATSVVKHIAEKCHLDKPHLVTAHPNLNRDKSKSFKDSAACREYNKHFGGKITYLTWYSPATDDKWVRTEANPTTSTRDQDQQGPDRKRKHHKGGGGRGEGRFGRGGRDNH